MRRKNDYSTTKNILTIFKMKNFALCAKSLMLILAVLAVSCSDNGSADATKTETKVESAPAVTLNIRYIDGDSIAAHYNLAKDFKEAQLRSFSALAVLNSRSPVRQSSRRSTTTAISAKQAIRPM